jgi:hypothetical protein
MPDETTTTSTTAEPALPSSPRDRAMAAIDRLGWEGEGEPQTTSEPSPSPQGGERTAEAGNQDAGSSPAGSTEPDPLAELAKKVEAKLKAKAQPAPAPPTLRADKAAFQQNPIAYLESLGLDPLETADTLFDYSSLKPEERAARAQAAELDRYRAAEKARKEQEIADREAAADEAAEQGYLAHLERAKDKYPALMALAPTERLRYTQHVAQMIVDAGEDAGPDRLAELTELHLARLAKRLGAGAQVQKATAVAGDRNNESADGSALRTITSQLAAESGSPAVRDLSPEGRREAAKRMAAALGW